MKMVFGILGGVLLLLVFTLAWCGYPWALGEKTVSPGIDHIEPLEMVDVEAEPSVVKVLTWNVSFLYGEGSEGAGYVSQGKAYYQERLDAMAKEINEWRPDVVCLQEVDFDAGRSHGMNQAHYIAEKAGFTYVAEAVSWEANYVPFPYWPFSNHFGRMKSGGAVLSRYPLTAHEVRLLPKPASNPWWYNIFYPQRYFQRVSVAIGPKTFHLVNLHLEAFDIKNREAQVKLLLEDVRQNKTDFVAGDFNMVPKSASKKTKFKNGDDYEGDSSFRLMLKSGLEEVVPEVIYSQSESSYFTFPSSKPDRRLDYIFYGPGPKMMKAEVLPSALSDHLPLRASFQVGSPKINPYSL